MSDGLSPQARLLRGFAFDFLACHDVRVVERIMDPAYCLAIGRHVLAGRDDVYLPATAAQLEQFPGLCVTVHDVVLGSEAIAMRFTEHGVSTRNKGRAAAWGGITMFRISDGRLIQGWAEEDYFARKRQLATGICDPVKAPHPSPWDGAVEPSSDDALARARAWLDDPGAFSGAVAVDEICSQGPRYSELIDVEHFVVEEMFSAGGRVAFRVVGHGRYAGGFGDIDPVLAGQPITLSVVGLLDVREGAVTHVQIAFDRLGLHRELLNRT